MIKSNEVRIGNCVEYNSAHPGFNKGTKNEKHFICKIGNEDGFALSDGFDNWYNEDELNPIPLTPEILEKAGFVGKYKSVGYSFIKDGVGLSSQDETDDGFPIRDYVFHVYYNYTGVPIFYVHQLQNLYFALTGEELEIKL